MAAGIISIFKEESGTTLADILTKALSTDKRVNMWGMIMLTEEWLMAHLPLKW